MTEFQRARSDDAKRARETSILDAARALGAKRSIRSVTLTDIAEAVGMHKSALLRYFETREQIFLRLTADGWVDWSAALLARLDGLSRVSPEAIAAAFASTLAERGMFCDLLAQTPLNLERNVSVEAVRVFKLGTHEQVDAISASVCRLLPALDARDGVDLVAAAVSHAGYLWQISTPGAELAALYRSDPRLAHAIIDFEPRLKRLLAALIIGMLA